VRGEHHGGSRGDGEEQEGGRERGRLGGWRASHRGSFVLAQLLDGMARGRREQRLDMLRAAGPAASR